MSKNTRYSMLLGLILLCGSSAAEGLKSNGGYNPLDYQYYALYPQWPPMLNEPGIQRPDHDERAILLKLDFKTVYQLQNLYDYLGGMREARDRLIGKDCSLGQLTRVVAGYQVLIWPERLVECENYADRLRNKSYAPLINSLNKKFGAKYLPPVGEYSAISDWLTRFKSIQHFRSVQGCDGASRIMMFGNENQKASEYERMKGICPPLWVSIFDPKSKLLDGKQSINPAADVSNDVDQMDDNKKDLVSDLENIANGKYSSGSVDLDAIRVFNERRLRPQNNRELLHGNMNEQGKMGEIMGLKIYGSNGILGESMNSLENNNESYESTSSQDPLARVSGCDQVAFTQAGQKFAQDRLPSIQRMTSTQEQACAMGKLQLEALHIELKYFSRCDPKNVPSIRNQIIASNQQLKSVCSLR